MRNLTKGMTNKETRAWIADKRKNMKKMTLEEMTEFGKEMQAIREESSYGRFEERFKEWFAGVAAVLFVIAIILWYSGWRP
jgi:hypothetical protein